MGGYGDIGQHVFDYPLILDLYSKIEMEEISDRVDVISLQDILPLYASANNVPKMHGNIKALIFYDACQTNVDAQNVQHV